MPSVVVGVEADEVGFEDRLEHLLTHWQGPVDLRAWEGCVQEPAHLKQHTNGQSQLTNERAVDCNDSLSETQETVDMLCRQALPTLQSEFDRPD